MRANDSLRKVIRRNQTYDKKLCAKSNGLLYSVTEQETRLLQRSRSPLSEGKSLRALERDSYSCTYCGRMQVWILGDKREMCNRHYRECGFSYYSRTNIALDMHHVVPVPFGDDDPDNLAVVCREYHRALSVVLCSYQAEVFDKFGVIYVDLETKNRIERISNELASSNQVLVAAM